MGESTAFPAFRRRGHTVRPDRPCPRACSYRGNLGAINAYQGKYEKARERYAELVDATQSGLGYHPDLVSYIANLSWIEPSLASPEEQLGSPVRFEHGIYGLYAKWFRILSKY